MREILFRGKRVDNGEWVYGYPLIDNAQCSLKEKGRCKCAHDGSYAVIIAWVDDYHEYEDFEVDPETVGQYTGMTDKNGTKIFEGDILQCWDEYNTIEFWAVVVFGNPNCTYSWGWSLKLLRGDEPNLDILCWVGMEDTGAFCEVIGNIHDNPELLTEDTP